MIEILATGLQATVQDQGRAGFGHLGVPEAGAADGVSLALANRLVGNAESAAGIEVLLGGLVVRFHRPMRFALSGAPVAAELDGRPVAFGTSSFAEAGQTLTTTTVSFGLRTYVAFAGGIDIEPVLGSRSTDTLSGIGHPPLRRGERLPVGSARAPGAPVDFSVTPTVSCASSLDVAIRLGPRDDHFLPEAIALLTSARWEVGHETDRVATRLIGPTLQTATSAQLPTEGLGLGSLQVPPSGQPILHLANHPPTGGYPVIAVAAGTDVCRVAQAAPGTVLRFRLLPRLTLD